MEQISWILTLLPLFLSAQNLTDNSLGYRPKYQHPAYRLLPQRTNVPIPRSFIIGRTVGSVAQASDRELPCCRDESGGSLCKTLKTNDPRGFGTRCSSEPDFSLVVCCKTCNEIGIDYRERADSFFSGTQNTTNCFDRMSINYCSRFQTGTDAWNARRWSCETEHYRLGFRVCRSTCGFCNLDWKNAKETEKCNKEVGAFARRHHRRSLVVSSVDPLPTSTPMTNLRPNLPDWLYHLSSKISQTFQSSTGLINGYSA